MIDLRRSLDYLETRADINPDAIGYFGYSQGAVQAPIVLAWEPRIEVAVGTVGFIPPQNLEPPADPLHALPRVQQPFLLLSGEFDSTAQLPNARRYFEPPGTPAADKKHVVTRGSLCPASSSCARRSTRSIAISGRRATCEAAASAPGYLRSTIARR